MKSMGEIIKEERTVKGITQSELAKAVGVTQDSISLWELGKRLPDTIYLRRICKILDISADYLLGLENEDGAKIAESYGVIVMPARCVFVALKCRGIAIVACREYHNATCWAILSGGVEEWAVLYLKKVQSFPFCSKRQS